MSAQHSTHPHPEFASGSVVWLKELQLKQEEMNRRRKQQEERERWISECSSGTDLVGPFKKECVRDVANQNHPVLSVDNNHHSTQSLPKLTQTSHKGYSISDQQKSVRDLASKFENISFSSPIPGEAFLEEKGRSTNAVSPTHDFYKTTDPNAQTVPCETEHHRHHTSPNHRCTPDKAPKQTEYSTKSAIGEDKSLLAKMPYATSGSIYHPYLTDAQLTNVLRIGTNRSSFRNSNQNGESQDDTVSCHPRDVHDARRPDKPPDYETAIQRLELLRHDRGFSKLYANNCVNFEAILEQAKKRKGPKKSVTFSDKVVLVACAGDEDNDFIPNPLLERVYKQHFMQKPSITDPAVVAQQNNECSQSPKVPKDSPASETAALATPDAKHSEVSKHSPCNLCHKKSVDSPKLYCPDCAYYMSRFQQK